MEAEGARCPKAQSRHPDVVALETLLGVMDPKSAKWSFSLVQTDVQTLSESPKSLGASPIFNFTRVPSGRHCAPRRAAPRRAAPPSRRRRSVRAAPRRSLRRTLPSRERNGTRGRAARCGLARARRRARRAQAAARHPRDGAGELQELCRGTARGALPQGAGAGGPLGEAARVHARREARRAGGRKKRQTFVRARRATPPLPRTGPLGRGKGGGGHGTGPSHAPHALGGAPMAPHHCAHRVRTCSAPQGATFR